MKIILHLSFKKAYKKRIVNNQKLVKKTTERIKLFQIDRQSSLLKDHALIGGKRDFRAFSVTGDVRIVYQEKGRDSVIFYDIGSHNQVY